MGKGLSLFRRQCFMGQAENRKTAFLGKKNVNKDWRKHKHFLAKYQLKKNSIFQKTPFLEPRS